MLKNYQNAIMKPYFDAGLKHLASVSGYPASSIQSESQFKRTHQFIMEAWEAIYRTMLIQFMNTHHKQSKMMSLPKENFIQEFMCHLDQQSHHMKQFLKARARCDSTWQFWRQFDFEDAMAYI